MNSSIVSEWKLKDPSEIFHFLWFFGEKTNEYLETFSRRFKMFSELLDFEESLVCGIYEVSKIMDHTKDWISTDVGLITIRNLSVSTLKGFSEDSEMNSTVNSYGSSETNSTENPQKNLKMKSRSSKKIFSKPDSFDVVLSGNVFSWTEGENEWFLNVENKAASKITIKNNWNDQPKDFFIESEFGPFVIDSFIHNDRFILNISNEFLKSDEIFDLWDIDKEVYIICRRGRTEIFPMFSI